MIRRPLFLLLSLVLVVAVLAGLAYRPATIAGVHSGDLESSLEGAASGLSNSSCEERPADIWRCESHRNARGHTASVEYRVEVHGHFGCWDARRIAGRGPRKLSACITLRDYL